MTSRTTATVRVVLRAPVRFGGVAWVAGDLVNVDAMRAARLVGLGLAEVASDGETTVAPTGELRLVSRLAGDDDTYPFRMTGPWVPRRPA
jgi:hypothetical protein